ncbi:hypothetical protein HNQ07_003393 [Deinococcus metalli]|uniref:Uncharacterized protein n=1 Tax=Deinococcus metalli TaxID=1141878 RepID=A0A7W8KHI8_9DEIO|nr:hypothetical protein [Deinococcus metalli]MBB5377893.1 hypothetical protein [Deinococcus metalli]GHF55255.1 hypothetical protein GCM10017781_34420 [Deinococcus metalli]
MSLKDNFSTQEWFQIMTGPGRAGAAVVAASPSGLTGLLAEAQAIAASIRESVSSAGRTPLMEAMAADLLGKGPNPEELRDLQGERAKNMQEAVEQNVQAVRQAVWLVSAKTSPEDAQAYRDMLMQVAERTAQAAKEGGFLGIGGEQVNDKERDVLAELQGVIRGTGQGTALTTPDASGNAT